MLLPACNGGGGGGGSSSSSSVKFSSGHQVSSQAAPEKIAAQEETQTLVQELQKNFPQYQLDANDLEVLADEGVMDENSSETESLNILAKK